MFYYFEWQIRYTPHYLWLSELNIVCVLCRHTIFACFLFINFAMQHFYMRITKQIDNNDERCIIWLSGFGWSIRRNRYTFNEKWVDTSNTTNKQNKTTEEEEKKSNRIEYTHEKLHIDYVKCSECVYGVAPQCPCFVLMCGERETLTKWSTVNVSFCFAFILWLHLASTIHTHFSSVYFSRFFFSPVVFYAVSLVEVFEIRI